MNVTAEEKLKERIKELTCLYEISSLIANSNLKNLQPTLQAICRSLKKAVQFPKDVSVELIVENYNLHEGRATDGKVNMLAKINAFKTSIGAIIIGYSKDKYTTNSFLNEERQLLETIGLEIGKLFERKQITEREIRTKQQVERADRLSILGEITAGIAHELNTPLANILGYAELVKEQTQDNNTIVKDLDKIINSAIYSREVVKKLMFFSCEMPQHKTKTNIVPIITEAIKLLKPNFSKKQLSCCLQTQTDSVFYKVDTIQLTQVVFNIIMNAIYFSPEKGKIEVKLYEDNNNVYIDISDEGEGIESAKSELVFNPFYSTKDVGEGTGLGLSVVHGIMQSHQGSITHQPNDPKGTVFNLVFPK
ncbi:sensor histidine kinase [Mangrovimonas cancribranchiae]|uniref:histidine kinase n=1 Tax=Mangrovimonas cancribranchiae TaxID=3080055 RepID=A0AAU6P9W1_9FLAO